MNINKSTVASIAVASLIALAPFAASANTVGASGSTGILISPSGIVRVIGADVTSVGTNVVNAVLNIGSTVITVVLNTSGNTKIVANGSKTATTTDIKVGDDIAFKGTLSSSTPGSLTVAATKVRDTTSFPFPQFAIGTISSVNTTNNSFVVTNNSKTTTVFTNTSTAFTLNGASSSLVSLPVNSKVVVTGTRNADGSITATKVAVNTMAVVKPVVKNDKDDNGNSGKGNSGDDVKKGGIRFGLNIFGGLHLGKDE